MTKSSENVRRMVLCAMFTALVAVCSQIAVPMPWGVPINLALFAVYMAGTMLGPVWGTASQVVFIALAAIGVPVLANFQGGPSAIFGKTGGYAIGYILTALLTALCQAVPQVRIRLGSLEPRVITEDFCRELRGYPNLCPQFHLSMQSGCDTVLKRMRRKYDTGRYYESLRLLREYFPGCAVTTDMIVAFPGETEEEFRMSLDFIRRCAFADMHIFPYSRRPGTPADTMPGQLGNAVKEARSREAIALAQQMNTAYRQALVGATQQVLFEDRHLAYFTGHAPNYVKVYAVGEDLHNELRNVKITGLYEDGVFGVID